MAMTAVDPAGRRTPIEFGPSGAAELGDGVRVRVPRGLALPDDADPADGNSAAGTDSATDDEAAIDAGRVIAVVLAGLLAGALLVYLSRRRRTVVDQEPFGPNFVSEAGVPDERFEEFVAMLAADPDPARAIRLAFSAAECGVGGLPRRITTETPFEWCERVVAGNTELGSPLRALCDRFARARFAPEPPSFADRDAAIADLVAVNQLARETDMPPVAVEPAGGERPTTGGG